MTFSVVQLQQSNYRGGVHMDLKKLESDFKQNVLRNEDDVKLHFHSDIVKPILNEVNP